jgi:hypothetical protein
VFAAVEGRRIILSRRGQIPLGTIYSHTSTGKCSNYYGNPDEVEYTHWDYQMVDPPEAPPPSQHTWYALSWAVERGNITSWACELCSNNSSSSAPPTLWVLNSVVRTRTSNLFESTFISILHYYYANNGGGLPKKGQVSSPSKLGSCTFFVFLIFLLLLLL